MAAAAARARGWTVLDFLTPPQSLASGRSSAHARSRAVQQRSRKRNQTCNLKLTHLTSQPRASSQSSPSTASSSSSVAKA